MGRKPTSARPPNADIHWTGTKRAQDACRGASVDDFASLVRAECCQVSVAAEIWRGIAREAFKGLRRADFPFWLGSQCGVEEAVGEEEQVCGWICFLSVSSMSEEDGGAADGLLEI